ncbi:MAG: metalloregulator ArsR/SmtB family transcription factor [Rhodospirillales bacterium]|nr:metalloregulator ArsR/SmtB family transcription factor [Rhodospirillales bacterium]
MDLDAQKIDADVFLSALKAAADATRLRILALCAHGDLTVSELMEILGQSQPRVSRHLRLLVNAGLMDRFREGSWVFHRLSHDGPLAGFVRHLVDTLDTRGVLLALEFERLQHVKKIRAETAQAYFRAHAADWDNLRKLHVDDAEVERLIGDMLPDRGLGHLLDVGTGTGWILRVLAPRIERGEGIDLSREMLSVARANIERAGLSHCAVRQADMYDLPFDEESFDCVTIHQVLHFADDPARAIAESARVLRPGGRMLVVDFAPHDLESLRDEHEHRRLGFADSELRAYFDQAGLNGSAVRHLSGNPLTVAIWRAEKRRPAKEV